jgi:hypothetical protein
MNGYIPVTKWKMRRFRLSSTVCLAALCVMGWIGCREWLRTQRLTAWNERFAYTEEESAKANAFAADYVVDEGALGANGAYDAATLAKAEARKSFDYVLRIHPRLNFFVFRVTRAATNYSGAFEIEISRGNDPTVIQTLRRVHSDFPLNNGLDWLKTQDMNFDGYRDLLVTSGGGSGGTLYDVWLFDAAFGRFHDLPDLQEFSELVADPKRRRIHSWSANGSAAFQHDIYEWRQGRLQLIASERQKPKYSFARKNSQSSAAAKLRQWLGDTLKLSWLTEESRSIREVYEMRKGELRFVEKETVRETN